MPMQQMIEILRFGSSIPGHYWGCCAADIIQCFNVDPAGPAAIEITSGDGGSPILSKEGKPQFFGKTNEEVFLQRLRRGTFGSGDMPNHAFFAIMTESQVNGTNGKKWLAILKREGFEFVRTVCNSVYSGPSVLSKAKVSKTVGNNKNHIFALFRNIGNGAVGDPYQPPKAWSDMDEVAPELWSRIKDDTHDIANKQREAQLELWKNLPPYTTYTQEELEKEGHTNIMLSGRRGGALAKKAPALKNKAPAKVSKPFAKA